MDQTPNDQVPHQKPDNPAQANSAEPTILLPETRLGAETLEVQNFPLDPRFIGMSKVIGLIVWGVVALVGFIGLAVLWFVQGVDSILLGGLAVYVLANGLLCWLALVWPAIEYRHCRWYLDETGLEIFRGVFWKRRISVPLARLQHADISQGPIQRQFGLAKLTIHTAGTSNASVELDGIAYETAVWLRDQLIRHRKELDVV